MVIWIIGMSASGKTTLGKAMYKIVKEKHANTVFLDGDIFRELMGNDLGHSMEDRRKNADRLSRFCQWFANEHINVVCAILSLFHDSQRWNKENIPGYREVYIKVPFDKLVERETKGLYKEALAGRKKSVVGVDIDFPPPYAPDVVVDNSEDRTEFETLAREVLLKLGIEV